MAIPSIDSYLQKTLKTNIDYLLSNSYIIKEQVLRDFEPSIRDSFIHTFCTDNGNLGTEIPVQFTFPASAESKSAYVLIQFKSSIENEDGKGDSLGTLQGAGNSSDGQYIHESCKLNKGFMASGEPYSYIETAHPIYEVHQIANFSDNMILRIADNKVYISWSESMESHIGSSVDVSYSAQATDTDNKVTEGSSVNYYGFDLTETYAIDYISNNMDTLRCLDAIIKMAVTVMRLNAEEQITARLANLSFKGVDLIQEVNNSTNSLNGNQLFYRRVLITYTVPYNIEVDKGTVLKGMTFN